MKVPVIRDSMIFPKQLQPTHGKVSAIEQQIDIDKGLNHKVIREKVNNLIK